MPIQQNQLSPIRTGVTYEDINNTPATRILHNGSDFLKCRAGEIKPLSPVLTYYTTNGELASSYTMEKDYVLDITYGRQERKYYQVVLRYDHTGSSSTTTTGVPAITTWDDDFSETISGIEYPLGTGQTIDNNEFLNPYRWYPYSSSVLKRDTVNERLNFIRPFGEQDFGEILTFSGNDLAVASGYTTSIDFNFPLLGDSSKEDAYCQLKVRNKFTVSGVGILTPYQRLIDFYTVGARTDVSAGQVERFRIGVSGSDDITALHATYFGQITMADSSTDTLVDWVSDYSGNELTVKVTCITGASNIISANSIRWIVEYDIGSLSVTGALGPHPDYDYNLGPIYFDLTNETRNDDGWLQCTSGESIEFQVNVDSFTNATATGAIDITRGLVGNQVTFSTTLNGSYDMVYDSSSVFSSSGSSTVSLFGKSLQFQEIPLYFDNFTVTSGAAGDILETKGHITSTTIDYDFYNLTLDEIDDEGQVVSTIVEKLDILPSGGKEQDFDLISKSGIIGLTIDDFGGAFIKVFDDIYRINVSGTYSSALYDETSPNISVASGIISATEVYSLSFNQTATRFLQYIEYDGNTDEVRLRTLNITGSGAPTVSVREIFLDIPDWNEQVNNDTPYDLLLHGVDHNTVFYFRRNGDNNLNGSKSNDSDGIFENPNQFKSAAANFLLDGLQIGDSLEATYERTQAPIPPVQVTSIHEITNIVDSNTLELDFIPTPGSVTSAVVYKIRSNADLMQFNVDSSLSAFASVNVDDFSLRAGTSDSTTVRAEVINAWGDALQGKTVHFIVSNGDGVVTPGTDTTDVDGKATSTYQAGTNPGAVEITATVSD